MTQDPAAWQPKRGGPWHCGRWRLRGLRLVPVGGCGSLNKGSSTACWQCLKERNS